MAQSKTRPETNFTIYGKREKLIFRDIFPPSMAWLLLFVKTKIYLVPSNEILPIINHQAI